MRSLWRPWSRPCCARRYARSSVPLVHTRSGRAACGADARGAPRQARASRAQATRCRRPRRPTCGWLCAPRWARMPRPSPVCAHCLEPKCKRACCDATGLSCAICVQQVALPVSIVLLRCLRRLLCWFCTVCTLVLFGALCPPLRCCVPQHGAAQEPRRALAGGRPPPPEAVRARWRQWVAVRDAPSPGHPWRFSEAQLRYHYTADRAALAAAVAAPPLR